MRIRLSYDAHENRERVTLPMLGDGEKKLPLVLLGEFVAALDLEELAALEGSLD